METTTVTKCEVLKHWEKDGRKVPIYQVQLSDGQVAESFGKEIPVGTPLDQLEITKGDYGFKVKWNQPNKGGFTRQRSGNESFALSYSKDLVVAGKVSIDQILMTADRLYNWLESKKK